MNILLVETNPSLGNVWARHLERHGLSTAVALTHEDAINHLQFHAVDVLVINIAEKGSANFAITDFATYRNPNVAIIGVNAQNFFSDGSIFKLVPNMRGCLSDTPKLDDLTAMVQHYGGAVVG